MSYDVVQVAAASSSSASGTTSVTLAGCTPGNLLVMIAFCQSNNPPGTMSFPSGFAIDEEINIGSPGLVSMASRICPASPGSSWAVSHATSGDHAVCIVELPPGAADVNASTRDVSSTLNAPSITPTAGGDSILLIGGAYGAGYDVSPEPSGYTMIAEEFMSNGSSRFFVAKKLIDPATGSYSSTYGAEGNSVVAETIHAAYTEATPPVVRAHGIII